MHRMRMRSLLRGRGGCVMTQSHPTPRTLRGDYQGQVWLALLAVLRNLTRNRSRATQPPDLSDPQDWGVRAVCRVRWPWPSRLKRSLE